MSWTPYFNVSQKNPWPAYVSMVRPKTKEVRKYVPESTCTVETTHWYDDPLPKRSHYIELSCHTLDSWNEDEPPLFCPYCGKKVVRQ